jgi:hypothetical protein
MPLLHPAGIALSRPASPRRLQSHTLARSLCVSLLMYAALLSPLRHQARAFNTLQPLSMCMSAVSIPSAQKLRVVTYNILTPNYATPRALPVRISFFIINFDSCRRAFFSGVSLCLNQYTPLPSLPRSGTLLALSCPKTLRLFDSPPLPSSSYRPTQPCI